MTRSEVRSVLLTLVLATVCSCAVVSKPGSISNPIHPSFQDAGKTPGLEIWRIENFEPVKQPKSSYGTFFTGDSYIILGKTKGLASYDIHYWIGSKSTQDEAGAAALLSTNLGDALYKRALHHRELQNHESKLFLSYFENGVNYVNGGIDTGFDHAETNPDGEKRLFQVSGLKEVSVSQVNMSKSSINENDCFLLDAGKTIYVYVGLNSSVAEKRKASILAIQIREKDHNGRSKVEIIDQYSSRKDRESFFKVLESGSEA